MAPLELDPDLLATLRVLDEQRVEYILVGDVADAIHEGGGYIDGVGIVPSGYARNVERLAAALTALNADLRIAGESQTLPVDLDPARLRELPRCTLATDHADIELDFEPAGTAGYPDLYADARRVELDGNVTPQVASPEDLDRIDASRASGPTAWPTAGPADARVRAPARLR